MSCSNNSPLPAVFYPSCRYLTLFAAVFPAAAPLCLLLTLAKIKLDCLQLTAVQQRPVPLQLAGIGAWNSVLTVLVRGKAVAVVAAIKL
jgi:hypothetical protein